MNKQAVWSYGFRPFFLAGSLIGGLLISYWAIAYYYGDLPGGFFEATYWHAHEMIYGFVLAIVAGFLLTSTANWTSTKALSGTKLIALFALWLLGRVAFLFSLYELPVSPWIYSVVDLLFIPGLILALGPPLIKAQKFRNSQFILVLSLLWIGNLLMHLGALNVVDFYYAGKGMYLGMHLILLILIIIGGRVIPFFTGNAVAGSNIIKNNLLEKLVLISVVAYISLDFFENEAWLTGWVALVAGIVNLARLITWKPQKTFKLPLLWILYLGYLWIVIGFLLVFLSDVLGILPKSVAIHAFTAGAMSTFIVGMISRVSLGHTGRKLILPYGFTLAYLLITFSGVIRVTSGFFDQYYAEGIILSGVFWAASFVLFIIYFFKILITPRPDGKA